MKTFNLILIRIVCLAAAVVCAEASGTGVNLVQNGGFSSPDGTTIPGWTISGGLMWSSFNGVGGSQFVGIGGTFSQTLATDPGQKYLLEFYTTTAVPGISQGGPYGLSVTWGSQPAVSYTSTHEIYNWVAVDLEVVAQSSQTVLTFNRFYGSIPYLDSVTVVPIPEPGSVAVCVLAIVLFAFWRSSPFNALRVSGAAEK